MVWIFDDTLTGCVMLPRHWAGAMQERRISIGRDGYPGTCVADELKIVSSYSRVCQ